MCEVIGSCEIPASEGKKKKKKVIERDFYLLLAWSHDATSNTKIWASLEVVVAKEPSGESFFRISSLVRLPREWCTAAVYCCTHKPPAGSNAGVELFQTAVLLDSPTELIRTNLHSSTANSRFSGRSMTAKCLDWIKERQSWWFMISSCISFIILIW